MKKTYIYKSKSGKKINSYSETYDKDDLEIVAAFYGEEEWDADMEAVLKYDQKMYLITNDKFFDD